MEAKTAYLGDGINDAPALITATEGIAFGKNSGIAPEAARAVVMDSSLEKVDEFFHISRRMRRIGLQSVLGGMLLSILGMGFATFDFSHPCIRDDYSGSDRCISENSLRTIWKPTFLSGIPAIGNETSKCKLKI